LVDAFADRFASLISYLADFLTPTPSRVPPPWTPPETYRRPETEQQRQLRGR
jgi:hypothetical protein